MNFFSVITVSEYSKWEQIILSFPQYDVYYLNDYVKPFQAHGDGEPLLISYDNGKLRAVKVVMKRDIGLFEPFLGKIENNKYFDFVTPYGYGGFLFDGIVTNIELSEFKNQYDLFCEEYNIISDFVRYHPIISNSNNMRSISNVKDLGHTISMDLSSEIIIWNNIISKNKNMIRKAQKSGIEILHNKSRELLVKFINIYSNEMDRDNADPYYYFGEEFYNSIFTDLKDNYEIFYAVLDERIIAMSIILYANKRMHYHLSGTCFEYRNLAPTNLLLYEAACWGCKQDFKIFHLGGGLGSSEDNLFKFKKSFNRNSKHQFSIGKMICNQDIYNKMVELRRKEDPSFNMESLFFPLYRANH